MFEKWAPFLRIIFFLTTFLSLGLAAEDNRWWDLNSCKCCNKRDKDSNKNESGTELKEQELISQCESELERFIPEYEICVPDNCRNCNSRYGPYELDRNDSVSCYHQELDITYQCSAWD